MSAQPDAPRDRDELLERMAIWRDTMLILFGHIGDEALINPRDAAGWTAKDHFYHLAVWRQIQFARLRGESEYAVVGLPDQASYDALCGSEDFRAINAHIAERGRALTPAAVYAQYVAMDDALRAEIGPRDFASLFADAPPGASEGGSLMDTIICNTYAHDEMHRAYILRIVGE